MGNKSSLNLSPAEEKQYNKIGIKINQATNYKVLLKNNSSQNPRIKNENNTLGKENIEYSKINAISEDLKKMILKKPKAEDEK